MIHVLVCDDQDVIREGLAVLIGRAPGFEVVGTASDGAEAVEAVARLRPEVVLMDLRMPILNGIHATRQIRTQHPATQVLVLTTYDADEWVFDAIRSGATGYLLKDCSTEQLLEAIRGAAAGLTHVDPHVAGQLFARLSSEALPPATTTVASLSAREREVLALLGEGASNAAIAKALFLSEGTVRNYMTSIFAKLGVTDRTQAAVYALRYGLAPRRPAK